MSELGIKPIEGSKFELDPRKSGEDFLKVITYFWVLPQQCGWIIHLKKFLINRTAQQKW